MSYTLAVLLSMSIGVAYAHNENSQSLLRSGALKETLFGRICFRIADKRANRVIRSVTKEAPKRKICGISAGHGCICGWTSIQRARVNADHALQRPGRCR